MVNKYLILTPQNKTLDANLTAKNPAVTLKIVKNDQKWPKCSFKAPGHVQDDIFWGF